MPMPRASLPDVTTLLPLPPAVFHILVSLAGGDAHGYAIMQEVAARAGVRLGRARCTRRCDGCSSRD